MFIPLLTTKYHLPQLPGDLVARPGVVSRLEAGIQRKLTLVAAPAGFGKTTVVRQWAQRWTHPVAWVSLDPTDNDPPRFWAYLVAGLRAAVSIDGFLAEIVPSQPPSTPALLAHLVNALATLDQKVVLVLDDYQVISDDQIHAGLRDLIANQPPSLHIFLLTRADPPFPIPRLRGSGMLSELRADDLRFNPGEAANFLNKIKGLDLGPREVKALIQRTEGWAIGLQLAALSMQNRVNKADFVAEFSGGHHFVLEYLAEEVLKKIDPDLRTFLFETAILDRFCAPLCEAVTGRPNARITLDRLIRDNLFTIPLDQDHKWYRYHHLFADLLVNFAQDVFPENEILERYQRAARWYLERGDPEAAIRYALRGQDYAQAAEWIEGAATSVIARGQIKTLLGWIAQLPSEIVAARPRTLMYKGYGIFLTGQVNRATQVLGGAKRALDSIPTGPDRDLLHGQLSALLATITALTRDLPSAIAEAEEALAFLPRTANIFRARAFRALGVCKIFQGDLLAGLNHLETAKNLALEGDNRFLAAEILSQVGSARMNQGRLSLAAEAFRQILALFNKPDNAPPACLGYIGLAEVALERNQLVETRDFLDAGVKLCQAGSIGYALQPAFLIGGLVDLALRGKRAGLATIRKGEDLSRQGGGSLESILRLAVFQTRLHLQLGDIETARDWALGKRLPVGWSFDDLPTTLDEIHQSLLARLHLKSGEAQQVVEITSQIIPQAEAGGRLARVIELSLYQALAYQELGQTAEALRSLVPCLALAADESYLRVFLEAGDPARILLGTAASRGSFPDQAVKILVAFGETSSDNQSSIPKPLIEPLSRRERQVLELIAAGRTNQQIAETLVVTLNTVKKHTSNIYGKLGVRNRTEAVARGREQNFI